MVTRHTHNNVKKVGMKAMNIQFGWKYVLIVI